jgi:MFS family permease
MMARVPSMKRTTTSPADDARRPAEQSGGAGHGGGTFAALAAPTYRRYWIGLVLYVLGHRAEYVTYAWMVWELTADPLYLGYLGLAQGAPFVLLQLGGGVLADRIDRLRLLQVTTLCTGTVLVAAFALTASGLARVEHLLLLGALNSIFRSFDDPSRQALLPQLIDRARLPNAVALGSVPWQGGRVLGPSLTGVLIATAGGPIGFAWAAGVTFAALVLYSGIKIEAGKQLAAGTGVRRELADGLRFIGRHPLIRNLIGLGLFNSLFGMSYVALLPVFADLYFGAGSEGYGSMQAAHGIGSVVATLVVATLAHRSRHRGLTVLLAATAFGMLLMTFAQSPTIAVALPVLLLLGLSNTLYMTTINTMLQEQVPDHLRGRVMSCFTLCYNLVPFGGILAGGLAALVDARFALLMGGMLVTAAAVALLALSRQLRSTA